MTDVIEDIMLERERQKVIENWSPEHDDTHQKGELARAAACYAYHGALFSKVRDVELYEKQKNQAYRSAIIPISRMWPWDWEWWKPKDRRRDLVRAAALLVAEIERLDRLDAQTEKLDVDAA